MATQYTFNFTDTTKADFTVQAYTSNGYLSPTDNTFIPQAITASTTLKLYGKGMQEYGEGIEQNLIYMLENFANPVRPLESIEGQLWYNNIGIGSPSSGAELFIRNSNTDDTAGGVGWDAVILATGTSPMTGELILSGIPVNTNAAVPMLYVDNHIADDVLHLTSDQNTFLDALSLPTLTALEVDQLVGINTTVTVQTQIDDKISRSGDTMDASANLSFNIGEVLGLPAIPSVNDAAASKLYVDNQLVSGVGGDGYLNLVEWFTPVPEPIIPGNSLKFTISQFGQPDTVLTAYGISREGHFHQAVDIVYDNTLNPIYPIDLQNVIDYIETNKADLQNPTFVDNITVTNNINGFTGTFTAAVSAGEPNNASDLTTKNYVDNLAQVTTTTNIIRTLDVLSAPISSGSPVSPYATYLHIAGDNKLSITINGIKQYASSNALQQVQFSNTISEIALDTFTGLDNTLTYDFDVAINGATAITITIPSGSAIATHSNLFDTINGIMNGGSPLLGVSYGLNLSLNNIEEFVGNVTGSTASILISDPGTANQYLFATDPSPITITSAVFYSNLSSSGSPAPVPDEIIVAGDVTANFTIGKTFTILSSVDTTYGTYDGVYSVHQNGAVYDGSTSTTIPIATVDDSSVNTPLLPAYTPIGSPPTNAPAPTNFGSIYSTPLGGFVQILTQTNGIDGDYVETDPTGIPELVGEVAEAVVFNVAIPAGATIETLLLEQ